MLLFLPPPLTLSVLGRLMRRNFRVHVRIGSRVALLVRRLQVIFWLKHNVNVTVFRQIGLPLVSAHLGVTTQAVWKHVMLVFFLFFNIGLHNSNLHLENYVYLIFYGMGNSRSKSYYKQPQSHSTAISV